MFKNEGRQFWLGPCAQTHFYDAGATQERIFEVHQLGVYNELHPEILLMRKCVTVGGNMLPDPKRSMLAPRRRRRSTPEKSRRENKSNASQYKVVGGEVEKHPELKEERSLSACNAVQSKLCEDL